jgi:hypothetical protein
MHPPHGATRPTRALACSLEPQVLGTQHPHGLRQQPKPKLLLGVASKLNPFVLGQGSKLSPFGLRFFSSFKFGFITCIRIFQDLYSRNNNKKKKLIASINFPNFILSLDILIRWRPDD